MNRYLFFFKDFFRKIIYISFLFTIISSTVTAQNVNDIPKMPGVYYKSNNTYVKIPGCPTKKCEGITEDWLKVAKKTSVPSKDPNFLLHSVLFSSDETNANDSITKKSTISLIKVSILQWNSNEIPQIDYDFKVIDSENNIALLVCKGQFKPGIYVILRSPNNVDRFGTVVDKEGITQYIAFDKGYNIIGRATPIIVFSINK